MGKNKARHILHGVLDCLPIILIPIFMIYSQNHEINDNTLQVQENKVVDFNQQFNYLDKPTSTFLNITYTNNNNGSYTINGLSNSNSYFIVYVINADDNYYLIKGCELNGSVNTYQIRCADHNGQTLGYDLGEGFKTYNGNGLTVFMRITANYNADNLIMTPQIFNLTEMFGEGNEPTIEQFNTYFPNSYYPYTESEEVVIENYETITYNDTDIMSQSFYCLYNAVDKYFNMGNVFGMKNLYTWFEVNIFGGTASPSIYIVWNIVLYEFIMDLLFLLYGLFMFFIDLCKRLMEKPLNSIK